MSGNDFLTLAVRLSAGSTEAEWRTAVSRAYYAAFHVARDLFTGMGFAVPQTDQAHHYLYVRLNNCGHAQLQQAAADLHTLRTLRNRADYELKRPHDPQATGNGLQLARAIIQTLALATVEPTRTQVRDAIVNYERTVLHQVTWSPPPP
jgi:hypothetical protein